jgi:hypothetical protein
MKMEQSVPKRRHIKLKRQGITQKKAYNRHHFVCKRTKIMNIITITIISRDKVNIKYDINNIIMANYPAAGWIVRSSDNSQYNV